jgi:hypothetical protein
MGFNSGLKGLNYSHITTLYHKMLIGCNGATEELVMAARTTMKLQSLIMKVTVCIGHLENT